MEITIERPAEQTVHVRQVQAPPLQVQSQQVTQQTQQLQKQVQSQAAPAVKHRQVTVMAPQELSSAKRIRIELTTVQDMISQVM